MSSCGPAAQSGLPFDDAVEQPQLATKSMQEEHSLNGVYRVGDYYQLSLLVLHQGSDHTDPCSMVRWSRSEDAPFASGPFLSMGRQLWLWPVSVGKLGHLRSCFAVS